MSSKALQELLNEYAKSKIQSEAEVRSKFVVPLINALGYPSELRAEEYPVYGYAGRESLNAKPADFILFTDKSFADYKKKNQKCRRWVESHSLLVVEAKKPGELKETKIEDVIGQARFYREWSKAVAYILTDGVFIYGFFHNSVVEDYQAVSSEVKELLYEENIWEFSYENLQRIKNDQMELLSQPVLKDDVQFVISDDDIDIPPETLSYMKTALGKNSLGLSNVEVVAKFLNITESILNNDLRYNIPKYMLSFPRHTYRAQLFIDRSPAPCFEGEAIEFYRDDIERFEFNNTCVDMDVVLIDGNVCQLGMAIHILDVSVERRISYLNTVMKMLEAKEIYIRVYADNMNRMIRIPVSEAHYNWKTEKSAYKECELWMDSLEKLKALEDYYDIKFELEYIDGKENVENFYNSLSFVYSGIIMQQNSVISGPKPKELKLRKMKNEEPLFLEEIPENKRAQITIHGITFETDRSYIVPNKVRKKRGNIVIPICCECIALH